MKRKLSTGWVVGLALLLFGSCQKYAPMQPIGGDTYLRIFNSITNCQTSGLFTNTRQDIVSRRILCVLIDPKQDAGGRWTGAEQVGDFLEGRAYYAAPFESHPNDEVSRYLNTEYPGAYRVQTGGVVNGLDLSRWERISPGKHRLVILRRMPTNIGFAEYTAQGRDTAFTTAIDTTLDLGEKTIYTLEVLSKDTKDPAPLKLLVRKEGLGTDDLSDTTSMYVNFYNNLETPGSPAALDVYYQTEYVVHMTDIPRMSMGIPFTYALPPYPPTGFPGQYDYYRVTTAEQRLVSMTEKSGVATPYVKIPMPPVDSFYYADGAGLGQYRLPFDRPHTVFNFYLPGQSAATGAKPFVQLVGNQLYGQRILNAPPEASSAFGGIPVNPNTAYQTITNAKGVSWSFPLVSSFELMTVYQQMNQPTVGVVVYQVSTQRPPPAGLIE